jgi:adenylate cyclase
VNILRYANYALSIALTFFFLLHVTSIVPVRFLNTAEKQSYDARLNLMLQQTNDKQVVLIDIDEKSLAALGQWPWTRTVLADIVDALFDHYQIKMVGFDMVFAEAEDNDGLRLLRQLANGPLKDNDAFLKEFTNISNSIQPDTRFAQSLRKRRTVLGFIMDTDTHKGQLPDPVALMDTATQYPIPFTIANSYTANLDILQSSARSAGFIDNPLLDNDGVTRRAALLQQNGSAVFESLALAISRAAIGAPKLELIARSNQDNSNDSVLEWLKLGDLLIPVDEHAGVLVPYIGKQRSFMYITAIDVLEKKAPTYLLRGKIALFGSSAAGLHDVHTTPLQAAFPGFEIHANIIQGILDRTVMHQPGYTAAVEFIILLTLGLILTFLLPRLAPIWGMIVCSLLVVVLIAGNLIAWTSYQLVLPIATPVLLVVFLLFMQMAYGFAVENRAKRKLTRLFGHYIPPALLDEIRLNMEEVNLDGELRDMTVLFSDVRNFTSISENMEPEEITRLINAILTPMTDTIHQHRGTIDKYMGDAVMAFWAAPLEDPQHALHALCAAMDMIQRIHELNGEFAARDWPEINIGIGINTGAMNVGNKGSQFRVDYTVLGDAVNLGARLEKLTKFYGVEIIVGENTRHVVAEFEFRELARVRVKGRDKPVTIYEPLGQNDSISESDRTNLERYQLALRYFCARQWDDAERELDVLTRADPQRKIYQIYLDRIDHYREHPPSDDWDGSYCHESV